MKNVLEPKVGLGTKIFYAVIGILIFNTAYYLYNSRGGKFLVYACNKTTDKCYVIEGDAERETLASPSIVLHFDNGGSLKITCYEEEGCISEEGDNWSIHKIRRL